MPGGAALTGPTEWIIFNFGGGNFLYADTACNAPPHPGPLPQGEGENLYLWLRLAGKNLSSSLSMAMTPVV
ncbi:hypothetical protein CHU32_11845 [Superficieibacter electus]|uniref:Uncharacterized protein n=1 Tax=Superficieibacter electus TaxID=2022662 RepID=A0A2P5GQH8_9ENTR|nr:hypothetical protein CHU33_08915 [Superficieibacter electus]POP48800.1 hypothetical protein CHU32_11845 [Superficieibacter electus]